MSRPFIDFVRTDDLPISPVEIRSPMQAWQRTLSIDPDTGGQTVIIDLPAGWSAPGGRWNTDIETFIVTGSVDVGDVRFERYAYAFTPMGTQFAASRTRTGVRMLVFSSSRPRWMAADEDAPGASHERAVDRVHLSDVPWEPPQLPGFLPGAASKTLRKDPETEEVFRVLGMLPQWSSPRREWHEFDEENYVLEGECETTAGLMTPGCYVSHPAGPDNAHGPMRSRSGLLMISRTRGPMVSNYESTDLGVLRGVWR